MESNEEKEVKKTKTYGFWMSVCSAVALVVVQILGIFKVYVETKIVSDIISSILGALVVIGILSGPVKTDEIDVVINKNTENENQSESEKEHKNNLEEKGD